MDVAIIDYGMGNLKNVQKAFASLGIQAGITADKKTIDGAKRIVLPGVGAFKDAIATLRETGLDETICKNVKEGKPFLGICLGMQILFEKSYENGVYEGLQILPGEIIKFDIPTDFKVPHMGWNTLEITKRAPLYEGIESGSHVYFVHSYHVQTEENLVSSYTTYGKRVAVSVQKDNIFATQFHPEKSDVMGLKLLNNFIKL